MKLNPRRMRPIQLVQTLNSTALGEVISERQLLRHRARAGLRIGDGRTVDLLRYAAWLMLERHRPRPESNPAADYEALKQRAAHRNRQLALIGRDIGPLAEVANPDRRGSSQQSFQRFCEVYLPATFHLVWSPDHLKVIARIEDAVLRGGLFAMAMPRGSGKTSLCEAACLWALLYGHREFVALIGSDEEHAENMLTSIKTELETNDRLLGDFPEVCQPIRALEGIHQRAAGQLYQGRQTHIGWTAKEIVLPSIAGSQSAGSVMRVAGITGRVRGMKHKRIDGSTIRPALVLIDDPQTDESARSLPQCATRERILSGAVLGLAGPGRKIAGLMTLTVVRQDDLADRILDPEKHPQWQGHRSKMVYQFPRHEKLWTKYAELWRDGMRHQRGLADATAFYLANREKMDKGAQVAWEQRFNPDEISALQHAMNLRLDRGDAAFWAEYQNEPLPDVQLGDDALEADVLCQRLSGVPRGRAPLDSTLLTMFIDVQGKLLYWMVCAWKEDFSGSIVDYGTEPEQKTSYFTLRDAKRTLAQAYPSRGPGGMILAGLRKLSARLLEKEWSCEDGSELRIERGMVDANWGQSTDVVYQFVRQSQHAGLLRASHGRYVGASSIPMSEYKRAPGDRVGLNWRIPAGSRRASRYVLFDTNYWKSFIAGRLRIADGDPGALTLFGRDPKAHRMLCEHLTSEHSVRTEGRGRTVDEWRLRPSGGDNHWLDCLVGCAVAASVHGLHPPELPPPRQRRRVKYSEMQAAAQAGIVYEEGGGSWSPML